MKVKEYLKNYTETGITKSFLPEDTESMEVLISKDTACYLTFPELGETDGLIKMLARYEITDVHSTITEPDPERYPVANYGYSKKENKWYGWSHRAVFGFTVGSTCKAGDAHYMPVNDKDYMDSSIRFWTDEYSKDVHIENLTDTGFDVVWTYTDDVPNKAIRGQKGYIHDEFPEHYGRGEWTAETMEDARQMAMDFANNVG